MFVCVDGTEPSGHGFSVISRIPQCSQNKDNLHRNVTPSRGFIFLLYKKKSFLHFVQNSDEVSLFSQRRRRKKKKVQGLDFRASSPLWMSLHSNNSSFLVVRHVWGVALPWRCCKSWPTGKLLRCVMGAEW